MIKIAYVEKPVEVKCCDMCELELEKVNIEGLEDLKLYPGDVTCTSIKTTGRGLVKTVKSFVLCEECTDKFNLHISEFIK